MYFSFSWRYFKAKKSANAINIIAWVTVGVIAFATCCQILVLSVFNGFEGLVKSLYSSFYTDLKIVPVSGKTFLLTPEKIALIGSLKGIGEYSMIVEEKALLQNEDAQTALYLKGVDSNFKKVSGVPYKIINGNFNTGTADEPNIILGSGLQNAAAISLNPAFKAPHLTIILPKKNSNSIDALESLSEGNLTATGVFSIQQDFDNQYAFTNIDFMKQQMGLQANEYTAIELNLIPDQSLEDAKKSIQSAVGTGLKVLTRFQQNSSLYQTMQLEKWAIYAVLTLILIIAAFNMVSALTMLVLEKKKDISILQSMGGTKALIRKIFLSEGLLLGGIGAATGILLAVVICLLQIKFHLIKLQGGSFLIDYFPIKLLVPDFILVSITAIAIAFIASWFPAYKASKQSIDLR
ncbi:MAG: FtsX-like permease family protein [Ferruginibacter sp.]